ILRDLLSRANGKRLVMSSHDCSDGVIGLAIAEIAFAGGLGATVHLASVPRGEIINRDDVILFSESNSRFIVEVAPKSQDEFEGIMNGIRLAHIGQVTDSEMLTVYGLNEQEVVAKSLGELKEAWQKPLRW
ncbi:MAG: phosphoribosylformylglycinamidine synthase, partial [Dehalococcoidales bacterium]|nr:phosphoribosylformylglycinamidine synthase [Dehalococcoidales bacterium]